MEVERNLRELWAKALPRSLIKANNINTCGRHFLLGDIAMVALSSSGENLVQFGQTSANIFDVAFLLGGFPQKVCFHK